MPGSGRTARTQQPFLQQCPGRCPGRIRTLRRKPEVLLSLRRRSDGLLSAGADAESFAATGTEPALPGSGVAKKSESSDADSTGFVSAGHFPGADDLAAADRFSRAWLAAGAVGFC